MQVEYVARRNVRILGRDYTPGTVIDDPMIPSRVLAALMNTRRIGQKLAGKPVGDLNVAAYAPAAPVVRYAPDLIVGGSTAAPDTATAPEAPPSPADDDFNVDTLRDAYDAVRIAEQSHLTLRQYMQSLCLAQNLPDYGDVTAMIKRLHRKG